MKDELIGCVGALLTASIVVIPAIVGAYYFILKPILAAP